MEVKCLDLDNKFLWNKHEVTVSRKAKKVITVYKIFAEEISPKNTVLDVYSNSETNYRFWVSEI